MRWQDTVIAITQIFFIVSMLPSILSKNKPALATCLMNVVLVGIIGFCLFTLELWLAGTTAVGIALTWVVLTIQILSNRRSR